MPPDPLLATIIDVTAGPDGSGMAGLTGDQLIGVIAGSRRLESRAAWYTLAAVAEFTARSDREELVGEFAADELACELHLTTQSAAGLMDYARAVTTRLPRCFAALGAGLLYPVHLRIIEEETRILADEDAAKADTALSQGAGSLTYGKLRAAVHRLVLELDPEAAERRKEAARRDAHVRPFRESSGNAGMEARELPSAEVLASWQHIEQRALDLRAAGVPGTLHELRVRAYLDLLQERDTRLAQSRPTPSEAAGGETEGNGHGPDGGPSSHSSPAPGPGPGGSPSSGRETGPGLAALVTITVPWSTTTGRSAAPADVDGFGVVDAGEARDLLAAAARDPRTRWCVTALGPDGTAAAHGCASGRHPPPGPVNPTVSFGPAEGPDPPGQAGHPTVNSAPRTDPGRPDPATDPDPPPDGRPESWLGVRMTPITRGACDHDHAETGYRPSRKLRHLVRARNAGCTAPGCGRPAVRCDLDHTVAWDDGGLTCECDLAPLCRHHHRCKQAQGWLLEQPEPGVLIWRTPAGRSYLTAPTRYSA